MIQIWLSEEKREECEAIFLEYMKNILPFYPNEIYGTYLEEKDIQEKISEEKRVEIENTRKTLWKYQTLYRYLYLSGNSLDYPKSQEEAVKNSVHGNRLRELLVGPSDERKFGKLREYMKEIISEIGEIGTYKELKEIFRYDKFSDSRQAKSILRLIDMEVCPYCNRAFTSTIVRKNGGVRPQFDHYFPKDKYPYLAVSLYNLIPSCPKCNQFKSMHDTYEKPVLYPYDEGFGTEYIFVSYPKNGAMQYLKGRMEKEEFDLRIEPNLKKIYNQDILMGRQRMELEERIEESIKVFHLEAVYSAHVEFAADILKNRYIFGKEYIEMLQKKFPAADFSIQDVKKMLYCRDIRPEEWGRNILAKLVYDMDAEIERGKF